MKLYKIKIQNAKVHNGKLPYISDHPYLIPVIGSSGTEKRALLDLTNHQPNIEAKHEASN